MEQNTGSYKRRVKINLDKQMAKKRPAGRKTTLTAFKPSFKQIFLSVLVFAAAFGVIYAVDTSGILKPKLDIATGYYLVSTNAEVTPPSIEIPIPPQVRDKENPINGVLMTKKDYSNLLKRTPVAVTINNTSIARPQHGLTQADTVLEVLAEGGITRYVAMFYQNFDISKIGPVRSLRYYMIMWASGYADAIILHEGQAGYDNAPWETYREKADARGALYKFGIKSMQSAGSRYRDYDRAAQVGLVHALYTDFSLIKPEISRLGSILGWKIGSKNLEPLKFKYDAETEERGEFKAVTLEFLGLSTADYSSRFVYDKKSNTYKRFVGGVADIDQLNNEQIAPKNVVIEWHNYGDANDGHGRIIIDMLGEDKVTVLRDGKVINGTWKKECRTCRTNYFDTKGNEIEFVRGQIWVANVVKVGDREVSNVFINDGSTKNNEPANKT
ncbi:MAG: DUF3048 domain-containing protein [Candidatus Dojkabacteria bacterium]